MSAVLYSFRRCAYAMRGRMGLKASGLDYEHREIILRDKPQEMLEASPKGTVPVYIKEDGIRDFCLSRGLGDVYKRQHPDLS